MTSQWNQNPELIDDSLSLLTNLGLISETHNSSMSYVATPKGLQFLSDYSRLREQLPVDREAPEA